CTPVVHYQAANKLPLAKASVEIARQDLLVPALRPLLALLRGHDRVPLLQGTSAFIRGGSDTVPFPDAAAEKKEPLGTDLKVRQASSAEKEKKGLLEKVLDDISDRIYPRPEASSQDVSRVVTQGGEDSDPVARERRDKIKEMTLHAWKGYKTYAWGRNELRPVSRQWQTAGLFGARDMGATLVDSLDTLFIMGLMDEFNEAKKWVEKELDFNLLRSEVSLFEVNIRFVGGLLSAYALTGEAIFRERALQIATKLLPAFSSKSGIPFGLINTGNGKTNNHRWANGGSSILSEFGTLHLEFLYLSDVTGRPVFREKVFKIARPVGRGSHVSGDLFPNYMNPYNGQWGQRHTSLGAFGDSFYEYLIKSYIQSNSTDTQAKELYEDAIGTITDRLVHKTRSGLIYLAESMGTSLIHKMDHLACFAGGMYALGAKYLPRPTSKREMEIAEGIAQTCRETYARTATGLGPDSFHFPQMGTGQEILPSARHYALRPEAIETWFYLWRLTKDQKYRDWAWDAAMALEKHCRVESGGFSGLSDVHRTNPHKDDVQQSFLLAETLKYLYLIFSSDSLISLDQWVFNTEAHPIPILGKNALYRKA
ncbi:mannosyl-oligosaccharide 1,2-alpha-mannosidase IA-like, partial [Macrobrachium nipponense]|uniref:mannosyl-oligosaccharide 1,2-alpha-mannosidase IA-like n=1 Tax=Macrobrachium nipponense TaxID=159736 RepID=UPI0030C8332D